MDPCGTCGTSLGGDTWVAVKNDFGILYELPFVSQSAYAVALSGGALVAELVTTEASALLSTSFGLQADIVGHVRHVEASLVMLNIPLARLAFRPAVRGCKLGYTFINGIGGSLRHERRPCI